MPISLTRGQADVVRIIDELAGLLGRPPSVREVAHEYGTSKGTMYDMLHRIDARGWFEPRAKDEPFVARLRYRLKPLPDYELELMPAGIGYVTRRAEA